MTSHKKTHVLVVGGIREAHDQLLEAGCEISWLVLRDTLMAGDQDRTYRHLAIFSKDDSLAFLIELAETIDRHHPIERVCAFHDGAQPNALAIAQALGLPFGYTHAVLELTGDKFKMRQALVAGGLCQASSAKLANRDELAGFVKEQLAVERFIIKPVDGTGSHGVSAKTAEQLLSDDSGIEFPCLIEPFVVGDEYSVEAFSQNGIHHVVSITEKFKDPKSFVESGHLVPARLESCVAEQIALYVQRCLTTLGITNGASHSELIVTAQQQFYFIETHTRVGGDNIPQLVKLATGVDLYRLCALDAIGGSISPERLRVKSDGPSAAIAFLLQQPDPRPITSVDGTYAAQNLEGVLAVNVRFHEGDCLPEVKHSFDRAAWAIATASSPDGALSCSRQALSMLKFSHEGMA